MYGKRRKRENVQMFVEAALEIDFTLFDKG